MIMYMFKQTELSQSKAQNHFMQIAVSNWQLYKFSQISNHNENSPFGEKSAVESYIDFLAGIAVGDRKCLGENRKPDILIVREKELSESEYVALFARLCEKVENYRRRNWNRGGEQTGICPAKADAALLIPHTYLAASHSTDGEWLHLPFSLFEKYQAAKMLCGLKVGVSIHSVAEAQKAQQLGASYLTAGHIFATNCKKDVPPRGLGFLQQVCTSVCIPVYAIGGIHRENLPQVLQTKAAGACSMSEYILR